MTEFKSVPVDANESEPVKTMIEEFPIDYLILDVLHMKVEAWDSGNQKLFNYCTYLEERFLQVKKGEIKLDLKDVIRE